MYTCGRVGGLHLVMNKTGNDEITFYRAGGERRNKKKKEKKRKHLNEEILKLFLFYK